MWGYIWHGVSAVVGGVGGWCWDKISPFVPETVKKTIANKASVRVVTGLVTSMMVPLGVLSGLSAVAVKKYKGCSRKKRALMFVVVAGVLLLKLIPSIIIKMRRRH